VSVAIFEINRNCNFVCLILICGDVCKIGSSASDVEGGGRDIL
jgi:hypothetical protein